MAGRHPEGLRMGSSTKLVQEEKASNQDAERDPEMNIGGNRTERGAEAFRGHLQPQNEFLNLECHLRSGLSGSQCGAVVLQDFLWPPTYIQACVYHERETKTLFQVA